ncbi:hypothetical protein DAEQUDRAFT_713822 [Daedalea quercina L-15889]|uniref:Uncharacterized protein n=1 Tax=Daedalea quercina L-15889 TaxID=1314783 RepID=A0A165NMC5_9APHY|nr:hypothetical protein DAEQUDRAFT_713822 [Daedalea quercina L-15889]
MTTHTKQQTESATLCRIASIAPQQVSRKLRVAGRILVYDRHTSVMLLGDGNSAVLVDLALCLDPFKPTPWLRESNSTVMVIGSLEELETPYPLIELPLHARPVEVDLQLILHALSVRETRQLDLELWKRAITMREQYTTSRKNQ